MLGNWKLITQISSIILFYTMIIFLQTVKTVSRS